MTKTHYSLVISSNLRQKIREKLVLRFQSVNADSELEFFFHIKNKETLNAKSNKPNEIVNKLFCFFFFILHLIPVKSREKRIGAERK